MEKPAPLPPTFLIWYLSMTMYVFVSNPTSVKIELTLSWVFEKNSTQEKPLGWVAWRGKSLDRIGFKGWATDKLIPKVLQSWTLLTLVLLSCCSMICLKTHRFLYKYFQRTIVWSFMCCKLILVLDNQYPGISSTTSARSEPIVKLCLCHFIIQIKEAVLLTNSKTLPTIYDILDNQVRSI